MRKLSAIGVLLFAIGCSQAGQLDPAPAGAGGFCTEPDQQTGDWRVVDLRGASIRVPPEYARVATDTLETDFAGYAFSSGPHSFKFTTRSYRPKDYATVGDHVAWSCRLVLGGSPALINVYNGWDGGNETWWAIASWDSLPDRRYFEIATVGRYPSDLMAMRGVYWTIRFPGYQRVDPAPATR